MANPKIDTVIFQGTDGKQYDVPNQPEYLQQMQDAGFTLVKPEEESKGILGTVAEAARGAEEFIGSHALTNYNPLLKPEQYLLKGIASLGGAKPSDELPKPTEHKAGTVVFRGSDGTRYDVQDSPEAIDKMKAAGFIQEDEKQTKLEDIKARPEFQGARGAVRAYGEAAFNAYLFDLPGMMDNEDEKLQRQALEEEHPIATPLGTAGGFAANLLTPGLNLSAPANVAEKMVVKSLAKIGLEETGSLGARMAVGAAKQAAAGVVYSAPHAAGQAVYDSPKAAAETLAFGGGIGLPFGAGGPLASKLFDKLAPAAAVERFSNMRLLKNIGLERATMKEVGGLEEANRLGGIFNAEGIIHPGMGKEEIAKAVENAGKTYGKRIGEIQSTLDAHIAENPAAIADGFNVKSLLNRMNDELLSKNIGPKWESEARSILRDMHQILTDSGVNVKLKGTIEERAQQLLAAAENATPLTFEKAQELKNAFRVQNKSKFAFGQLTPDQQHGYLNKQSISTFIKNELDDATERVATAIDRPEFVADYQKAKTVYQAFKATEKMRMNQIAREEGNRWLSPSTIAWTMGGSVIGAINDPEHAVKGALQGAAVGLGKKALESGAFQSTLIAGANRLAGGMRAVAAGHVAERMAELDHMLQRIATRGAQSYLGKRKDEKPEVSPIAAVIGSNEKDPMKAYQAFKAQVEPLVKDPAKLHKRISAIAERIAETGDEETAFHYLDHQVKVLNHLYTQMPKAELNPALFFNPEFKPSLAQVKQFEDICSAAQDPFYLVRKIENGTLTDQQVATVREMFPEIFDLIKARVHSMGYEQQMAQNPVKIPYDVRIAMQRLTGALGDASMDPSNAAEIQAMYAKKKEGKGDGNGFAPSQGFTNNLATEVQRVGTKKT